MKKYTKDKACMLRDGKECLYPNTTKKCNQVCNLAREYEEDSPGVAFENYSEPLGEKMFLICREYTEIENCEPLVIATSIEKANEWVAQQPRQIGDFVVKDIPVIG